LTGHNVRKQFGQNAERYAVSEVHAQGADLEVVVRFARPEPWQVVLDVSTGPGYTAMALAPHVAKVIATDITPEMLRVAQRLADQRGLDNLEFREADVYSLPFSDSSFDLITCRTAAHHYPDLVSAVREMARLLKPKGRLVVSDTVSPPDEVAARFIHAVEVLRDATHVRNWSLAEWQAAFSAAGLVLEAHREMRVELEFEAWVERAATPPELRQVLLSMLTQAPTRLKEIFEVGSDPLRFCLHKAVFLAVRRHGIR
jgi:ubiquinone/menaquinone biosynthesis C-methylase UbiE